MTTTAKAKAARENGKLGGRPRVLTDDAFNLVLEGIMGGLSLLKACRKPGAPCVKSFLERVVDDQSGLGVRYARARNIQLLQMEEQLLQLADGKAAPGSDPKLAMAEIQRARLQVDTRKWLMSKLRPERYGDRVVLSGDSRGEPIRLSNTDAAREVALLLTTAAARRVKAEEAEQVKRIEAEVSDGDELE